MEKIIISGGKTLSGKIRISGSKNSALPILAATLLSKNKIILKNIPNLSDSNSMLKLLESLNSTILQTKEFEPRLLKDLLEMLPRTYRSIRQARLYPWSPAN